MTQLFLTRGNVDAFFLIQKWGETERNEELKNQEDFDHYEAMDTELEKEHIDLEQEKTMRIIGNEGAESEPERKRARRADDDSTVMAHPVEATTDKETSAMNITATEMATDTDTETKGNDEQKTTILEEAKDGRKSETKDENTTGLKDKEMGLERENQQQEQQQQQQPQQQTRFDLSSTTLFLRQELVPGEMAMTDGTGVAADRVPPAVRAEQEKQRATVKRQFAETVDQTERRYARLVAYNTTLALLKAQPLMCGREKKDDDPNFLAIGDLTSHRRAVSRKHFVITYDPDVKRFFIEVMSQNGLILDGHLFLDGKHPLHDNSVITVQCFTMTFVAPEGIIPPTNTTTTTTTTRLSLP